MSENDYSVTDNEKKLKKIGETTENNALGPIERAEILLIFSYRKLSIETMRSALRAVGILSVITQLPPKEVAMFIADAYKTFNYAFPEQKEKLVDILYENIKQSPVAPSDFIDAFKQSRQILLSNTVEPIAFLELLKQALEKGTPPNETRHYIMENKPKNV